MYLYARDESTRPKWPFDSIQIESEFPHFMKYIDVLLMILSLGIFISSNEILIIFEIEFINKKIKNNLFIFYYLIFLFL